MGEAVPSSGGKAGSDPGGSDRDFPPHPLLARFAKEAVNPSETTVLSGYFAPIDANVARIYLDLGFRTYVDVPRDKVLYVEGADSSAETKPTKIVLAGNPPLTVSASVGSSFLQGAITSEHPLTHAVARLLSGIVSFADCVPAQLGGLPQTRNPKTIVE